MRADIPSADHSPDLSRHCIAIAEHSPLPMVTVEGDRHIVRYANPAFCRLMEKPSGQLVGKPFDELLPEKDHCAKMLARVFRTGKPESHTETENSKAHPIFWSYTIWPVLADKGLVGVMIQVIETTQVHEKTVAMNEALLLGSLRQHELTEVAENLNAQLRAEIAARKQGEESLLLAGTAMEAAAYAIFITDREGVIQYVNPAFTKITGYAGGEAIGRKPNLVKSDIHGEAFYRAIWQTVCAGEVWLGEITNRHKDGHHYVSEQTIAPVKDALGEITHFVSLQQDITARKQAEEARARLAAIVESSAYAILSKDLNGIITSWNAGAETLFGYTAQEAIGQPVALLIPAEHRDEDGGILKRIRDGERIEHFETVRRRKDGTLLQVSLTVSPIVDSQGVIVGAAKIARDISERRVLEDALVARAEELAQADRSKDEFLAMLAHELRNPLAPLRNAAEIFRTPGADAAECAEAQGIMARQIENMTRMLDDLLDVSRITAGKIELRRRPAALAEILAAAASVARPGITARSQELALSLPAEPIFLNADATRLEQVFGNLLTNACKYSYTGSHITVSAERAAGMEPPEAIIRVRDDGMGIAPELLPHIFDLFVQSTRSLDREHGGLGIGLTLVRRLVQLHGGSVEARSEGLSFGSEFTVRLPILAGPVAAPSSPAPVARETPRRILIVDDNEDSTRSMAIIQKRRGHETRTAFTGPDAVTAAAEFLPEVVLLDIGLPGMDGYEVARRLRAMPALAGAFLVAMSGYGSDEDRAKANLAGFDFYMVKPVDLDHLRELLRSRK